MYGRCLDDFEESDGEVIVKICQLKSVGLFPQLTPALAAWFMCRIRRIQAGTF